MKRSDRSKSDSAGAARLTAIAVLSVGLWTGALGGAAYGLHVLDRIDTERAATTPMPIDWGASVPDWINTPNWNYIIDNIHAKLATEVTDGIRAPALSERIAQIVASSPWVRSVRRVSLRSDGVISIDAEFRRPVAVVVAGGHAYPVSQDGVRLSLQGYQLTAADVTVAGYLQIVGVENRVPVEGGAWSGRELYHALKLVAFLDRYDWTKPPMPDIRAKVNIIDASRHDSCRDPCLRVRTADGGLFEWGLPPGEEGGIEASAAEKFSKLVGVAEAGVPTDRLVDLRGMGTITYKLFVPPPPTPPSAPTPTDARHRR